MQNRLYPHQINLGAVVAVLAALPKSREVSLAITHLEEAQHLIAETAVLLQGTEDMQENDLTTYEVESPSQEHAAEHLERQLRELKDSALMSVKATQDQRADVMFAQSVFTQARIEVTQALYWLKR